MRLVAIFLVVLLAACAGDAPVHSDFNPTVDFSRFGSFSLVRPAIVIPPEASGPDRKAIETIFATIADDLRARAMEEVDEGADLSVNVTVQVGEQTGIDQWGYSWSPQGERVDGPTYEFREGTLVIDFFDTSNGQLVWRGWAQEAIARTADYDLSYLQAIVHAILDRYPPAVEG